MEFREGEIFDGGLSITGGEGARRRWIVVAPFGKCHLQSIDVPSDIRHRPLHAAERGLHEGHLHWIGYDPEHPVLLLQRLKEERQISDTHLGLRGENLRKMLRLLDAAARSGDPCTPFVAGEILCLHNEIRLPSRWEWRDGPGSREAVAERVTGLLEMWVMNRAPHETARPTAEKMGETRLDA